MEILGKGHKGIVVADTASTVQKFYASRTEAEAEQANLTFLELIQEQGFDIGCIIPKFVAELGEGHWDIDGNQYYYSNCMQRISGVCGRTVVNDLTDRQIASLGRQLGSVSAAIHTRSNAFVGQWKDQRGDNDELLTHIIEDKAGQVQREEPDESIAQRVSVAANYLQEVCASLTKEKTLSHLDFTLDNTQVDEGPRIVGIVDWGSFGLTHPSLSLYQLSTNSVWPHVKSQYEQLAGPLREDIIYAASVIHTAWAPIICEQLGLPIEPHEARDQFEAVNARFEDTLYKK